MHVIKDWARRVGNIQTRFAAWRSNEMEIAITALDSAWRVLRRGASFERNRLEYTKLCGVPHDGKSSKLNRERRQKGAAVRERVIG